MFTQFNSALFFKNEYGSGLHLYDIESLANIMKHANVMLDLLCNASSLHCVIHLQWGDHVKN